MKFHRPSAYVESASGPRNPALEKSLCRVRGHEELAAIGTNHPFDDFEPDRREKLCLVDKNEIVRRHDNGLLLQEPEEAQRDVGPVVFTVLEQPILVVFENLKNVTAWAFLESVTASGARCGQIIEQARDSLVFHPVDFVEEEIVGKSCPSSGSRGDGMIDCRAPFAKAQNLAPVRS